MPKKPYTFWLETEIAAALKAVKEDQGISESEQIRRGIRLWLDAQQVRRARVSASPSRRSQGRKATGVRKGKR